MCCYRHAAEYIIDTFLVHECCKMGNKVEPTLRKVNKKMTFHVGKGFRVTWLLFLNCPSWNMSYPVTVLSYACLFFPVKKYQSHIANFLLIRRGIPTDKSVIERKMY